MKILTILRDEVRDRPRRFFKFCERGCALLFLDQSDAFAVKPLRVAGIGVNLPLLIQERTHGYVFFYLFLAS